MKKVLTVVAAVGCLAAASTSFAALAAGTGVNGSLHDMTKLITNADVMDRVCVFCHTPHHAEVGTADDPLPLWNRNFSTFAPDKFEPYVWATPTNAKVDGVDFAITDPLMGPSRLCMSCHDGSVALDQHNQAMATGGSGVMIGSGNWGVTTEPTGRSNLGRDLDTTHPIGFDYNRVADWRNGRAHNGDESGTEIVRSTFGFATAIVSDVNTQGVYNKVTRSADGYRTIGDTLYKGSYMTCATCHEVHNKENATQEPYNGGPKQTFFGALEAPNYFLYAKQADSLICLSCHIK